MSPQQNLISLCFFFRLCWVFIGANGLSLVVSWGTSLDVVHGLLDASRVISLRCGAQALEHRPSSCGTWASLPHVMCSLPRAGIQLMSLALAGRFLTTGSPGKSGESYL